MLKLNLKLPFTKKPYEPSEIVLVNFEVDRKLLDAFDDVARRYFATRSEALRYLMLEFIKQNEG